MARKLTVWVLVAVMMLACISGAFAESEPVERTVEAVYEGAWVNIAEHQFKFVLPDGWQLIDDGDTIAILTAVDPETGNSVWIESLEGEGFTIEGVLEMFSGDEGFEEVQLYLINGKPFVHYRSPESNTRGYITLTADEKHILIFKFSPADDEAFAGFAEMMMSTLSAYTPTAAKTKKAEKKPDKTPEPEEEGEKIYTWADLLAAAAAGKEILLIASDITRGDDQETAVFYNAITIKGKGGNVYTIDGNGAQIIRVESAGESETLTGTTIVSNLTFINGGDGERSGGALFVEGDLVVEGSTFSDNVATSGGAIYVTGNVELTDVTITNNEADSSGGGVYAIGAVTLNSGTISNNVAYDGGGIYSGSIVTINDGLISYNEASYGGGIEVMNGEGIVVNGGTITGNSAGFGGGMAIYYSGSIIINNGVITNNTAYYRGGGIRAEEADVFINGGVISNNEVEEEEEEGEGGGVAVSWGTCEVTGGEISGNTAEYGGGLYLVETITNITGDVVITENSATYGGGVYAYSSDVTISGAGVITGNTADNGGGIYAEVSNVTISDDSAVTGNTGSDIHQE